MHRLIGFAAVIIAAVLLSSIAALGSAAKAKQLMFSAKLTGSAESGGGDADGSGTATFTLNPTTGKFCWVLAFKAIGTPTASHIHKGGAGVSGPVFIPLGGRFERTGCTTLDKTTISAFHIHVNPIMYVNIHNASFPNGAIRGALVYSGESGGLNDAHVLHLEPGRELTVAL